jgi:predicted O-methyltransferase YrrM
MLKTLGVNASEVESIYHELASKEALLKYMSDELQQLNFWQPNVYFLRQAELYCLVRLTKPKIVVETGVQNGISSTLILEALRDNKQGTLHSIEILEKLPRWLDRPVGWIVPEHLREHWKLQIGSSLELLPILFEKVNTDFFLHDSLHTYDHMMAEYKIAWPHLSSGGLLVSDDTGENEAFIHFCQSVKKSPSWAERGHGIIIK